MTQGSRGAYSKNLLPQKPPDTDGRLFPFARGSVFISSRGSKNARYAPGVFRFAPRHPPFLLVGRGTPRKGSPLASLPREVARLAATEGVSSPCLFSRVFLSFPDSFSRLRRQLPQEGAFFHPFFFRRAGNAACLRRAASKPRRGAKTRGIKYRPPLPPTTCSVSASRFFRGEREKTRKQKNN